MILKKITFGLLVAGTIVACSSAEKETQTYTGIQMAGAMKNVMWKGKLGSSIDLDTISDKNGLYGLGPQSYLTGELLINNGNCYVSKVTSDSTMAVEKRWDVSAPFLVYTRVKEWKEVELPATVKNTRDLEKFIDKTTGNYRRPFAFKLVGRVTSATIHIQNLPKGTKVSSPREAHQGQTNYALRDEAVEIVGFFSTEHQGVFTHHDSFLHMHLITADESKMGHLDKMEMEKMKLYLPKR